MAKARHFENTFESLSLQIAVAVGQGAGTTPVSGAAIVAAIDAYRTELTRQVGNWEAIAPAVLAWAGVVGRLSAWSAASDGRASIAPEDVDYALNGVRRRSDQLFLRCPLTIPRGIRKGADPLVRT